ncbi:cobyrinic acid a,c-diamide synthase [Haloferax elongans ATCC BAA-1513]|uniref:Cobyrinate a,c-diamide synthase n=1 Tax=Haloferax elongans ATCC BAA-1513 TaxID=1230453 RepID=M0H915_HALEO|nr:cobyrinic acid a,c-diamide synthase [Haloferax elongans]ELZ81011.1 cobyrinic acid a,c-diamide synthase [Haloferax elongans ATCC BAA-1513]
MKGFVLGGTSSGVGKTVATLAIVKALQDAGYSVQPAKAGPDFIDPSHHEQVAGRPSRTLDLWLEGDDGVRRNYYRGEGGICVVEGVMGLYDGDGSSTAMVAEALDIPVVLVVDAKAGMESVAATAHGFREYAAHAGRDIDVAGIVAQRAHGGRHENGIKDALPPGIDYFGRIPPRSNLEIPDRHLGLHMGDESPLDEDALSEAAESLRPEQLVDAAREPPRPASEEPPEKTGARVALARDEAFCFAYPASVERLRERADVVTFSPVAGDELPECDGVYLPGGYPELHGPELEQSPALDDIADRAADGLPVFGECGGLMALTESLTTDDGTYEMAGVLPASVTMCDRYQALDHVELQAKTDTLTAGQDGHLRGHEFHYSSADVDSDARFAFDVVRGSGIQDSSDGLFEYQTLGTYCHVHAESGAFDTFVERL